MDAAKCLDFLTDHQQLAIQTYLLSVKAGVSPDPGALMQSSKCLDMLSDKQLRNAIAYLLCQINNGGGGSCAALSGVSAPTGSVTPQFIGQLYNQNGGAAFFYSTGLTSADWTEITGGVGATEIVAGSSINNGTIAVVASDNLVKLDLSSLTGGGIDVESNAALVTLDLSALTSADGGVNIESNPALVTPDLSALTSADGGVIVVSNDALTTLDLSALTSAAGGVNVQSNAALTSVLIPNLLPTDGIALSFNGCALDATSVNLVLARCVAAGVTTCTIDLSGGTNSAPTGQGIVDAAALVLAGNTVTTN